MKILFLGDYSNLHATLSAYLRSQGHEVTVVSDAGNHIGSSCDILLRRSPGLINSGTYLLSALESMAKMRGYDIVQLINPHFLDLRPGKLKFLFNRLRRHNGKVFLTLAGTDHFYARECIEGSLLPYSEFHDGTKPNPYLSETAQRWLSPKVADFNRFIYDNVDGALSSLYEYHIVGRQQLGDRLAYAGIPVDMKSIASMPLPPVDRGIKLLIGIRSAQAHVKGSDTLLEIAKQLQTDYPDRCSVEIARDLPLRQYLRMLEESHVLLDQIYALSPATSALYAMSSQRLTASGAHPDFYKFIGEDTLQPIISATPDADTLYNSLAELCANPQLCETKVLEGVEFVKRHNDVAVVAQRYLNHWTRSL